MIILKRIHAIKIAPSYRGTRTLFPVRHAFAKLARLSADQPLANQHALRRESPPEQNLLEGPSASTSTNKWINQR